MLKKNIPGKYFVSLTFIFGFVAIGIVSQLHVPVASGALTTPFGGMIQEVQICDCTQNYWFRVGPPNPAAVVYSPLQNSILYKEGQIFRTGVNALGTYRTGGECIYYEPDCDNSRNVDGTVVIVGTSN